MKQLNMELFAKRLKTARTDKGITQKELSEKTGISSAMISAYESAGAKAGKNPTLNNIYIIANSLGVSIDWLCGSEKQEQEVTSEMLLSSIMELVFGEAGATISGEHDVECDKKGCPMFGEHYTIEFILPMETFFGSFLDDVIQIQGITIPEIVPDNLIKQIYQTFTDKYKQYDIKKLFEPLGDEQLPF